MNIYVFDSLIDPAFFMMHSYFKKNRLNEIIYLSGKNSITGSEHAFNLGLSGHLPYFASKLKNDPCFYATKVIAKLKPKKKKTRIILGLSRIKRVENFICHTFYCLLFFFFQVKRRSILSCDRRDGEIEISKQKKTTTTGIILDFF